MSDGRIRCGVIGGGYWGSKLSKIVFESPTFKMIGTADVDRKRGECSVAELLNNVEAVVIATPATTHEELALAALDEGKHVLVEKPMALDGAAARTMVGQAQASGLVLMTDHTYVYSPALETVQAALQDLGPVYAMHSARMHEGGPGDVSSLWDLLPHDLSILRTIAPGWWNGLPEVEVIGDEQAGVVSLWWGARTCRVQYSRRSPTKVRHFVIGTAEGEIRWSDWPVARVVLDRHGMAERLLPVPPGEPLKRCVEAFGEAIITGECPVTSGRSAVRIIDVIERASRSLAEALQESRAVA